MNEVLGVQRDLLCHNCGGQCIFDPAEAGLTCQSCATVRSLETEDDSSARAEFDYRAHWPQPDVQAPDGTHIHKCETCGGEVIFTDQALSDNCPYCDGPVVLGEMDSAYETMALIPFAVPRDKALRHVNDWVARRWAAPNDLGALVETGRAAGLYAPFWTFDSQEVVQYWATYVTGSGDNKRTHNTSGKTDIQFDDLLVPASHHVTPLIRDGILHDFRPHRLKPYISGYLAGFAAERHHQTINEGLKANEPDKRLLIRNRIKKMINKGRVTKIRFSNDTSGIRYRRILLPVWIMHYTYGGDAKKIVVSGIDGRTFGERPFSIWKLAAMSAALSAATIVLGLLWGASRIL